MSKPLPVVTFQPLAERIYPSLTYKGGLELRHADHPPYINVNIEESTDSDLVVNLILADSGHPGEYREFGFEECLSTEMLYRGCIFNLQGFGHDGDDRPVNILRAASEAALNTLGRLRFRRVVGRLVEVRLELGHNYLFTRIDTRADIERFFIFH